MTILAIETSCDETAVALYDKSKGLLAHEIYSQIPLHQPFGGVVPELASRDHLKKTIPLIKSTLKRAQISPKELKALAYTQGPGLVGSLLVGASIAKTLAFCWNLPAIGIHHMEGHLLAPMLEDPKPKYPFLALLVSGGHTQLVRVNDFADYQILGESLDDAAGEAFDKVAKLLGLPYPGGPEISRLAKLGNPDRYNFPRPLLKRKDLNFSFSGLKTAVMNQVNKTPLTLQIKADIALAFQDAVIDCLTEKSLRALAQTGLKTLVIAGGVGANQGLRERLKALSKEQGFDLFYPRPEFCTDNAAMIAYVGAERFERGEIDENLAIQAKARWTLQKS